MNTLPLVNFRPRRRVEFVRCLFSVLTLFALLALASNPAQAQGGGGHMLFGDVKADEGKTEGLKPMTFDILLYGLDGRVIARQKVSNGGRYRFFNVRSGEYDVAVEMENVEVARMRVSLGAASPASDFQRDIELEWKSEGKGAASVKKQTISAADFYERPSGNKSNFEKAQSAIDKKNYEQAATLLKLVLDADPKDFQAWTELGTVYVLQEKQDEAEKAYVRAIEARPTFFLALLNLGRVRVAQKQYEAAIDPLTHAVELQPTNAEANLRLGEAYLQLKKGSKAVTYLNEAARLGRTEAHLRLATLYNAAGLKDRAATEYEQFLTKEPNHPDRKKLEKYVSENKKQ